MSSQQREAAARDHRALWSAAMTHALDGRGLSLHAAARLAGFGPGELAAWLHHDVEPNPRALAPLAEVVGVPHLQQLALLGWLPAELVALLPSEFQGPQDRRGDWREHM